MNESMLKKLVEAGMTKPEAIVYMALLTQPSMTVQETTKQSGLPRSTVSLALEKFVRLGVIDEYTHGKRRNFVVSSTKAIELYVLEEEKKLAAHKANLGQLIMDLGQLHFLKQATDARVEILRGEEGFKELYKRTLNLKRGQEILRLSVEAEKFVFYPEFLQWYCKEKNKRGILTRLLIPESKLGQEVKSKKRDNADMRQTRLLPKKSYNPDSVVTIWGDSVAFTTWNENLETIVIKSKGAVDIFKSLFEMIWLIAKK